MNVLLALVSVPVLAVPVVARAPPQAPLAVQLVAPVDDQLRLAAPPDATDVGVAAKVTVGPGGAEFGFTFGAASPLEPPPHDASDAAKTMNSASL